MIDLKKIETYKENFNKRGYIMPENLINLLKIKKDLNNEIEYLNYLFNNQKSNKEDKLVLKQKKEILIQTNLDINNITHNIPNILHESVPYGINETNNSIIKLGNQEYLSNIKNINTDEIKYINTKLGATLAQSRFTVLNPNIATTQRKIINKALDFYIEQGYNEYYVPYLVNKETIFNTGQYPKFKDELFTTQGNNELFLIPTGEVPLTNLIKDKLFLENEVEQSFVTHTPCFRKEAGSAGKDTTGILRQHQFEKVELVKICLPENGLLNLEKMLYDVETFIKTFNIPYRIIELCSADIGFSGHKAYDIEMWFDKQKKYREIASITWCSDFQARRLNARYKTTENKKNLVHTINGTGLASGRVLSAIMNL